MDPVDEMVQAPSEPSLDSVLFNTGQDLLKAFDYNAQLAKMKQTHQDILLGDTVDGMKDGTLAQTFGFNGPNQQPLGTSNPSQLTARRDGTVVSTEGALKQTFGMNGPNDSGLGTLNLDGSLRQSNSKQLPAPTATVYPTLQPPGPRKDLRFKNFQGAKTLIAPKTPGVYAGGDKMDLVPKVTPATMPGAFQQPAVYPPQR